MNQLKAQEDTNASILLALTSLQKSIAETKVMNASFNAQSAPKAEKKAAKNAKAHKIDSGDCYDDDETDVKQRANDTMLQRRFGQAMEIEADCNDDFVMDSKGGRYRVRTRIPSWYVSNVQDILTDQYQRSREHIEDSRHETNYFSNMLKLKNLGSLK